MKNKNFPQLDEKITLSVPQNIGKILDLVAKEMEITKEELIIHVLNRWSKENLVNTGFRCSICQINTEISSDEK
ncbi:hypothetical protein [Methanospirillum sp.]|uniref:hypothetical protein n=1 Tax=Methanospirillum sp. TaxID=45200 RepID=UPI0029850518|nr:hypothetical protein [Methanospirillum sp.]